MERGEAVMEGLYMTKLVTYFYQDPSQWINIQVET